MARFFSSLYEMVEIQSFSGKLQNSLSQSSLYKNVMLDRVVRGRNVFSFVCQPFIIFLKKRKINNGPKHCLLGRQTTMPRWWPGRYTISLNHNWKDMLPGLEGELTYPGVFMVPKEDFSVGSSVSTNGLHCEQRTIYPEHDSLDKESAMLDEASSKPLLMGGLWNEFQG